jgi:hypothetical protein
MRTGKTTAHPRGVAIAALDLGEQGSFSRAPPALPMQ